ncbi:MAG TPA: long-chain fatty acid--CoA ligase [Verrucomicrobiae bacterium]
MSLHEEFIDMAGSSLSRTAIFWGDDKITYARLLAQVRALSQRLINEFGLKPGDRVAVWVKNCPEFPVAIFGSWHAGGVVVMVNNFLKPDEVAFILNDSGAKIVITDQSLTEHQAKVKTLVPDIRYIFVEQFTTTEDDSIEPVRRYKNELAALLYTSGTTGRPKGAMLTHGNFLANVKSCVQALEMTADDRIVVMLPQFHSFMFTVGSLLPLIGGASILLVKSLHPMKHVLEEIIRHRGTVLPAVPQIHRALASLPQGIELNLRLCVSGGAPLPMEVLHQFQQRFPKIKFLEGYGPTESSPVASVNPINGPQKPGSVGVAIPDVELSIRDESGNAQPHDVTGEICIKGPNVMQGYWKQPEESALVLRGGWLYTGDVGHRDADHFFYITDRKKDMLLVNGINVYPREIEEVIYKFPGIKETAVIGKPDARRGEQAVAFVALNEGVTLDEKALLAFIREKMADYKVPRKVIVVPALPRNATGKILKTELRKVEID